MKMRVEDGGACRKLVHVSVPAGETKSEYDNIVASFARTARVPGFRPGKAPSGVVERHYKHAIAEDMKDRLVPRYYREALKEKGIVPVAVVEVKDLTFSKESGVSFSVTVDVAPDFKLPKYKKISVKPGVVDVPEKEVENAYQRLLLSKTKFEPANDRACKLGDLVCIDYQGTLAGGPVRNLVADMPGLDQGTSFWVMLGEPEFLPGFPAAVAGMAIGENREIKVTFPGDYGVKQLAGKTVTYAVVMKEIKGKNVPPPDKELLDRFQVDSESALRQKIRDELKKAAEAKDRERMRGEVAKALTEGTKFELPRSVVDEEQHLAVRSILRRAAMGGMSRKQIEGQMPDIRKAAAETSTERVRLNYILSKIAVEEKIQVDEAAVDMQIDAMGENYRMSSEDVRRELKKSNGIDRLRFDILCDRTMDVLLDMAMKKE